MISFRQFLFAIFLISAALGGFMTGTAKGADVRVSMPLEAGWKIQPASSPETPPNDADWGTSASGSWKDAAGIKRQATSWKALDTTKVHSLWFEKELSIPALWQGKEIIVDFGRIEGDAIVFLGDRRVTELLRPGGQVCLTPLINFGGKNALRLFVTRDYTGISRKFEEDPLRYFVRTQGKIPMSAWGLGITAPVTLTARPKQAVSDVFVIPSWRKKELVLEVELATDQPVNGLCIEATIFNAAKQPVLHIKSKPLSLAAGKSTHTVTTQWVNPIGWELEKPYLYTVETKLKSGDRLVDSYSPVTFGFREIWAEGRKLMMNGHPSRWRLSEIYGADKNGISIYQLIGYNVGQIQPHPSLWWADWAETPTLDESLLDAMDRGGMGCTVPAPSVALLRDKLHQGNAAEDYNREVNFYLRKYRNHPCILAWVVGMNSYCPTQNITPQAMGIREENPKGQGKTINEAVDIVHRNDPTRLAYSHADGSTGDISTSNCYLNFVPLQEREEWPMSWAANGNMPYCAVEFGEPFTANYWKGKQFLLTEYIAMYLGDQAYLSEGEKGLRKTVDYALMNASGFGKWSKVDHSQYPGYWDFLHLFVKNTNRAWRTWGVDAGWMYWLVAERYGHPKNTLDVPVYEDLNYNFLTAPLTEKPAWASRNFDIFSEANKPLLTYIAGWPVHTDKTHSYFAGETLKKQLAIVWDGSTPCSLVAKWFLKEGEKTIVAGGNAIEMAPGEIHLSPITLALPKDLAARRDYSLELRVTQGDKLVGTDRFAIEVFPPSRPIVSNARIAVYDPLKKSLSELRELGLQAKEWSQGESLNDIDVLVVGREAIKPGQKLPYEATDIANGLRVILLEQSPEGWRSLGLETVETMPRYVFMRDQSNTVFKGLAARDFINWRGAPDLLPEGKQAMEYDTPHAAKWTNRHAIASVALKTPHVEGFTPLLETEFDLAYSPLLEWRNGKGAIYFCSIDFSNRLKSDPTAAILAKNLVEMVSTTSLPPTKRVFYVGGPEEESLLQALGLGVTKGMPSESARDAVLVVGRNADQLSVESLHSFEQTGGTVLWLMQPEQELQSKGYHTQRKPIQRADPGESTGVLRGIGPNLLRWQDVLDVAVFAPNDQPGEAQVLADGLLLDRKIGDGREVYLQVAPALLSNRYADNAVKREAIQLSVIRLNRLVAQVLANLGASPSPEVARRLSFSSEASSVSAAGSWKVLGPYKSEKSKGAAALSETLSEAAHSDAITGGENPNTTYKRPDGVVLDWRKTVEANTDGYIDLEKALGSTGPGNIAYITRSISVDHDQAVTFQLGVDYWMEVWINGSSVLKTDAPHGMPTPNGFVVETPLKQGKNTITIKAASGTNGFGVWCRMKTKASNQSEDAAAKTSLYSAPFKAFDPYKFTYW